MKIVRKIAFALIFVATVSGCASFQLSVMARDTGKAYSGTAEQTGSGRGTVSIVVDDKTYTGPYARTTTTEVSGFLSTFSGNNYGGRGAAFSSFSSYGGNVTSMALLSASDGSGMRCAFQAVVSTGTGGGLCIDNKGREFDVLFVTK